MQTQSPAYQIRIAAASDVPLLLPLIEAYWQFEAIAGFTPDQVATQLHRLLTESALGLGWMAFVEGRAVGYLLAVHVFSLEHLGNTAEIDEFFVLPQYRSDGIGAALLATAEASLRAAGCTSIALQLSRQNDAARGFYHRHGYVERDGYELLDKHLSMD